MSVVVTGGAGYIGSHVCKALKKIGYLPVVYDNFLGGYEWAVQWGPCIKGDIHDTELLEKTLHKYAPAGVIHLASHINVRESMIDPVKYYRNNLLGTLTLAQAMVRCHVPHLVFSSSAAVYGNPKEAKISEDHPKAPINTYGRSKWMAEELLQDMAAAHPFASVSLRYFNAAGADLDGDLGEAHDPETHLIPLAILAALEKKSALSLFGDDHSTADGTAVRDYIHVSDLADAHVKALEWLKVHNRTAAFNLGTGSGNSVREVLQTIETVSGKKVPHLIAPRFASDPAILVADARKAFQELGWQPQHSSLETIIETAWKWHVKR